MLPIYVRPKNPRQKASPELQRLSSRSALTVVERGHFVLGDLAEANEDEFAVRKVSQQ